MRMFKQKKHSWALPVVIDLFWLLCDRQILNDVSKDFFRQTIISPRQFLFGFVEAKIDIKWMRFQTDKSKE